MICSHSDGQQCNCDCNGSEQRASPVASSFAHIKITVKWSVVNFDLHLIFPVTDPHLITDTDCAWGVEKLLVYRSCVLEFNRTGQLHNVK